MNRLAKIAQSLHYLAFHALVKSLGGLKGARRSYALATAMANFRTKYGYIGSGWSKNVYLQTIKTFLPDISQAEAENLVAAYWVNHQKRFMELFMVRELTPQKLPSVVDFEGLEHLDAALSKGHGVLLPVPHIGNERLHHILLAVKGYPMSVISSSYADHGSYARKIKIEASKHFHDVGYAGDSRWLLSALKQNRVLQIASTAEAGSQGAFVQFLGQELLLPTGWARLALKTDAPVLPSALLRMPDDRFRLVIKPEFPLVRSGNRIADLQENVQKYMDVVADFYHQRPDLVDWMTMTVRLDETRHARQHSDKVNTL